MPNNHQDELLKKASDFRRRVNAIKASKTPPTPTPKVIIKPVTKENNPEYRRVLERIGI